MRYLNLFGGGMRISGPGGAGGRQRAGAGARGGGAGARSVAETARKAGRSGLKKLGGRKPSAKALRTARLAGQAAAAGVKPPYSDPGGRIGIKPWHTAAQKRRLAQAAAYNRAYNASLRAAASGRKQYPSYSPNAGKLKGAAALKVVNNSKQFHDMMRAHGPDWYNHKKDYGMFKAAVSRGIEKHGENLQTAIRNAGFPY